jgi:Calx-beta domain
MTGSFITRFRRLAAPLAALAVVAIAPAVADAKVGISDAQVKESDAGGATFAVTRDAPLLAGAISIGYTTENHTAEAPSDFVATSGTLNFPSALLGGRQTLYIHVAILNDQLPEDTEYFTMRLNGPELVDSGGNGQIFDDDPPAPTGRGTAVKFIREQLLARTPAGGLPNAPAIDPVISWDARTARYAAYVSAATNITP